jgi:hypothetical protein
MHAHPEYWQSTMATDRLKELEWDLIPASPHPAHMHMAPDR